MTKDINEAMTELGRLLSSCTGVQAVGILDDKLVIYTWPGMLDLRLDELSGGKFYEHPLVFKHFTRPDVVETIREAAKAETLEWNTCDRKGGCDPKEGCSYCGTSVIDLPTFDLEPKGPTGCTGPVISFIDEPSDFGLRPENIDWNKS